MGSTRISQIIDQFLRAHVEATYPVKLCNELEVEVDIALVAVVDQLEEVIVGVIRVVQLDVHGGPLLSTHLLLLR